MGRDMLSFARLADTADRTSGECRLEVDLSAGIATTSGADVYTISNVENITGSIFADCLRGDAGDNLIRGLGDYDLFIGTEGSDTYDGGTGRDTITYYEATAGITVSLFVDPDLEQLKGSARVKADYVEIHTGTYCDAKGKAKTSELAKIEEAIKAGRKLGLGVNAGHGLNYQNIKPVLALGGVEEYNIGHSIISRAVLVGLDRAVREMAELVHGS